MRMQSNPRECDVVVIGAGLAGHCAALAAAEAGARAVLLEKMPRYGGSTAMCGGSFAFAGTDMQRTAGIEDTPALLEEDLMKAGKYRNDRALVKTYAARQLDAYHWLKALGIRFEHVSLSGMQSVPRSHNTDPVRALEILHDKATASGRVTYRASSAVRQLLSHGDADSREVIGVVADTPEGRQVFRARGGVVIATGGFSRSAQLVETFVPHLRGARPMGGEGNEGDGLRMAWALGADLADMALAKGTFGAPLEARPAHAHAAVPRLISAMYRGAIVVNKGARRFVDESVSYKVIGDRCLEQRDATGFQIFDRKVMDRSAVFPTVNDFKAGHAAGLIRSAATLRELAGLLGLDAARLEETVKRYNDSVDGECEDELGRTSLSSGSGKPARIDAAPFYGFACTTGLTSTYCGLRTDTRARVIDVFGRPIGGLYATGEVVGGFHGESYLSGSSLAKGCIFGRIAAADAAARAGIIAKEGIAT
jgi:fumarate reductase flavoprotein subunit